MLLTVQLAAKKSYSLVHFDIVPRSFWKAKHPAHNPAAVEAPAQVTNLSPSPSMSHFHHTLCNQAFPFGSHEDGAKTDLFNLHLTGPLGEDAQHIYCYWSF